MKIIGIVFALITSTLFHKILCYSTGAPTSQCTNMEPNHGVSAQTGASPYGIKVNQPYYMPGENVQVTLESSGDDFRGFLIQARPVGGNSAIGMFVTVPANGQYLNCGNDKDAVTHRAGLSVKTVNFEWEPPMSFTENITFFATVVKDKNTFWVKLQSPELYKKEMQPNATTHAMNTTADTTMSTANMAKNTCNPANPKCDGIQLNYNALLLFFFGLFFVFWQYLL